ncbi:MAG: ComEC/Rec2 family competence protein [Candidatus Doudnabacteria bacterium]|nr:ComEC/Rec2 family competence protein [Candidatus Doudnabacteria bacterium]
MSKSKKFIWIVISFLLGVWTASLFLIEDLYVYFGIGFTAALAAVLYFYKQSFFGFLCICFIFLLSGMFRLNSAFVENGFADILGSRRILEGYVFEEPDIRADKQLLTIRPKNYAQNILVTTSLAQEFFYGDEVVVNGKIEEAENFSDFDYKGYLEMRNIYALSNRPKILILRSHQQNLVKEYILKIKSSFSKKVEENVAAPESGLLLGILIGAKRSMSESLNDMFKRAGLSHIVAVSGYNISIIIGGLSYAAWFIGRRRTFWLSVMCILVFVVLTGASASVVRAAIMGFLLLVAFNSGRLYNLAPALLFTAFVMVFENPKILVWDVGFQLSFLATVGIVYGVPVLNKLTNFWTAAKGVKNIFLTTFSAIVATLPLLLFKFGSLSVVAVLANLVVLPFVPFVMGVGFLSVTPFFGPGFGFLAGLFLKYIILATGILTSWRFASLELQISPLTFLLLYGLVFVIYLYLKEKTKKVEAMEEVW